MGLSEVTTALNWETEILHSASASDISTQSNYPKLEVSIIELMQIIEECLLSDIHTVCRFVCVMGINTVQGSEYSVQCKV